MQRIPHAGHDRLTSKHPARNLTAVLFFVAIAPWLTDRIAMVLA